MKKNSLIFILILTIFGLVLGFYNTWVQAVSITATIQIKGCGNEIMETGEQCDGSDLNGETCQSKGYDGGTLSCNADCTFNTSSCTTDTNGGNGVSGGGGYVAPTISTKVILSGRAYPGSDVHILSDGKLAKTVKADSKASFKTEIKDITPGIWSFSVWAIDKNNIKSITYTLTFRVAADTITTVSGIFLPPTINIDKNSLNRGEILNIFGQTVPNVQVDVHILSEETIEKVESDEIGAWLLAFNTQFLEQGSHVSKAQSQITPEEKSGFGQALTFYIGKAVPPELNPICPGADLNKDGRVNLIDFSVLLYWWGRENAGVDQNMNGIVDLPDFSIMLYYWTG